MKKKIFVISFILIFIVIVIISFFISFSNDAKLKQKREEIYSVVLNYLENKYDEKFEIINYRVEQVPYDTSIVSDEGIDGSKLYVMKLVSTRLIEFDAIYVEYLDEDVFVENKRNDIIVPGIYDNYIYEYKRRDINSEIKENIVNIMGNMKHIDVTLSDIGNYYIENLLIKQTLDSQEECILYDKYLSFNKYTSNLDFYHTTVDITNGDLIVNMNVNDYITENNINDFKNKVRKIVSYIQKRGYENYEINFILNKYQSAQVTKYLVDEQEKIYLIFDYEMYSIEEENNKLKAYILNK